MAGPLINTNERIFMFNICLCLSLIRTHPKATLCLINFLYQQKSLCNKTGKEIIGNSGYINLDISVSIKIVQLISKGRNLLDLVVACWILTAAA